MKTVEQVKKEFKDKFPNITDEQLEKLAIEAQKVIDEESAKQGETE